MTNNKVIAGLIVTFNPDIPRLKKNIDALKKNIGDNFLVVDNGSDNISEITTIVKNDHILKFTNNLGIAKAQNEGFKSLLKDKYEWIILLDQDSILPLNACDVVCSTKEFSEESTGIIGVSIRKDLPKRGVVEESQLISSGCFVRAEAWIKSGGMDEYLFIDFVDLDFDSRVLLAGYKLYEETDVVMEHEIGKTIYAPTLGKLLRLSYREGYFFDHSPIRIFYFYRNSIIVQKRYPDLFHVNYNLTFKYLKRTREIFAYKKPRMKKFFYALKGISEGRKYSPKRDKEFQSILEQIYEKN
ncbi:glycosyltransferase [Oenococcus oeni]